MIEVPSTTFAAEQILERADLQRLLRAKLAASVSVMTFDDLVEHYELYPAKAEPDAIEEARTRLAEFLEDAGGTKQS